MNITIDFTKYKSLGNQYLNVRPDNFASFTDAEDLYRRNKTAMDNSINEAAALQILFIGDTLRISTRQYRDNKLIQFLVFEVNEVTGGDYDISLMEVTY